MKEPKRFQVVTSRWVDCHPVVTLNATLSAMTDTSSYSETLSDQQDGDMTAEQTLMHKCVLLNTMKQSIALGSIIHPIIR